MHALLRRPNRGLDYDILEAKNKDGVGALKYIDTC
jgi:hypothetical protein